MKTKSIYIHLLVLSLLHILACAAPSLANADVVIPEVESSPAPTWSQRFPKLSVRVRHFDERISSSSEQVRLRLIKELTYFDNRNTRDYLPFFKALLQDASPIIRWDAAHRLWEHNRFLSARELPQSFTVPLVGLLDIEQPETIERIRGIALTSDAPAGWAIHALGIIGDKSSLPMAEELLGSSNIFTRFSAAVTLVQLGEKQKGMDALLAIADGTHGYSFYQYRAAETLYRFGNQTKLDVLIRSIDDSATNADGPISILEDLTGEYFATAEEWRDWLEKKPQAGTFSMQ